CSQGEGAARAVSGVALAGRRGNRAAALSRPRLASAHALRGENKRCTVRVLGAESPRVFPRCPQRAFGPPYATHGKRWNKGIGMERPSLRIVEGADMDKHRALEAALAQIDRNFGKGSIMRLGANDRIMDVEAISTGSLGLDIALGIGGLPRGRGIEIYGPEASGKTTLALSVVAESPKKGGISAFVDAEHALDPVYARKLGGKVEDLLISQPDAGEQALEIADTLVRSGAVDVLVVDSVAALTPRAELEGEMGDMQPGMQARLMSKALRKLTA